MYGRTTNKILNIGGKMNNQTKNEIGKLMVTVDLKKQNLRIFKEELNEPSFDYMIIDKKGNYYKLIVKSLSLNKFGSLEVRASQCKNYDFDILACHCIDTDAIAYIRKENISKVLTLKVNLIKNKKSKNAKMFSDYNNFPLKSRTGSPEK
jgi:hypothetical protein